MTSKKVDENNRRFFKRYNVYKRQVKETPFENGSHRVFGHEDLVFELVNVVNSSRLPDGWPNDRDNSDVELRVGTPGHTWLMTDKWVDDLVEFLQAVQRGRKE